MAGAEKILSVAIQISGAIDPSVNKATQSVGNSLSNIDLKSAATKAAIVAGVAAVGAAAVEAGKYLFNLGSDFQDAYNTIRIGTGATGEALEDLKGSFKEVYSSVPTDMETASTAIADYNTRLGLTGDQLESLSVQAIQVSNMLGEDLSSTIESSSKAFQAWNIDANDMGDAMDYVFKVSQNTGAGFNELLDSVQSFAPQLQEMGYSFEDATALIGQMDKAGVNTSEVLSAMKKSVSTLAKEGLSASEGMQVYSDKIKDAGDMTEATAIAAELFGTKSASTMAAAIRDGTISVEDLSAELERSGESINGAAEETYTFSDKLQLLQQKAETAIEPLAMKLIDLADQAIPYLTAAFDMIEPIIEQIATTAGPVLQTIFDAVSEIIPPIMDIIGLAMEIIGIISSTLSPVISAISGVLTGVLGGAISTVSGLISGLIGGIKSVADFLSGTFSSVWSNVWNGAKNIFSSFASGIAGLFKSPINTIIRGINTFIRGLNSIKIPSWVPVVGGKGFNLSTLPTLAEGGAVKTMAIAGEAGTEAVIGMHGNRKEAMRTWVQAGNILEQSPRRFANGGFTNSSVASSNVTKANTYLEGNHSGFVDRATMIEGDNVVISFRRDVHDQNVAYWQKAGEQLGILNNSSYFANGGFTNSSIASSNVTKANTTISAAAEDYNLLISLDMDIELPVPLETGGGASGNVFEVGNITYSPQITIESDSFSDEAKEKLEEVLKEDKEEFYDTLMELFEEMEVDDYA